VETAGEGKFSVDAFLCAYTNALRHAGWSVLFAAYEVGRASVLCDPTYVRHIKPIFCFIF